MCVRVVGLMVKRIEWLAQWSTGLAVFPLSGHQHGRLATEQASATKKSGTGHLDPDNLTLELEFRRQEADPNPSSQPPLGTKM